MPKYMLLVYADDAASEESERREALQPEAVRFAESLREAGVLLGADRLHPPRSATTVRVRGDETEILDGPFAVTKEYLGGYFLLECADLDEALDQAARLPMARFGSIEVRPVMDIGLPGASEPHAEPER